MKCIKKLFKEKWAQKASRFMQMVCYFVILFLVMGLILSFLGRQTFYLHTSTGTYERAIYSEENHEPVSRSLTITMEDDIHVIANDEGSIDFTTQIGIFLLYAIHAIPLIFAYWFLSQVFANIHQGEIFTEKNAFYLLYYGLIQFFVALFVPFIKLFICYLANLVSDSHISISTGSEMLHTLIPSIAFVVAAYIIHYGRSLQDEVDSTL